jgi:Arc/MetJ family transcription regulator
MYMKKRTTIELDEDLVARAKLALGKPTLRATVEEALRRAADGADEEVERRALTQMNYLRELAGRVDLDVLSSEDMWR